MVEIPTCLLLTPGLPGFLSFLLPDKVSVPLLPVQHVPAKEFLIEYMTHMSKEHTNICLSGSILRRSVSVPNYSRKDYYQNINQHIPYPGEKSVLNQLYPYSWFLSFW